MENHGYLEPASSHESEASPGTIELIKSLDLGDIDALRGLPEALGLIETEEMVELKDQLVAAMTSDSDTVRELATRYQLLAAAIVEQCQDTAYYRAQIGLTVQMAIIRHSAGREEDALEDLRDAAIYAENMLPRSEMEGLAAACADTLEAEDCADLLTMPADEAWGYAFTLLMEAGIDDPEAYLRDKGLLE